MIRTKKSDANGKGAGTVFVVDDDEAMRRGLKYLIRSDDYEVETFDCAQAFLDHYRPEMRGCLLLDVRMPGMSGLELQEHLQSEEINIPVIIVTAYADVPVAIRAMRAGAFDFIEKPFEGAELLDRIRSALARDSEIRTDEGLVRRIRNHLATLTPREREVMDLVVSGFLNKQIAAKFGITMKTVEKHRASMMEKMKVDSLATLVRMAMIGGAF